MAHASDTRADKTSWSLSDTEQGTQVTEALSKLRAMYDAGVPFFSKEAISDVCQKLKKIDENTKKISVMALDGTMVDFDIQTGDTLPAQDPELEYILQRPIIRYCSGPELIAPFPVLPDLVYCSLHILHKMAKRNKFSKEILSTPRRPYQEVAPHFKASQEAWKASDACKKLESSLLSAKISSEITKVVGFACGTGTGTNQNNVERSLFQHALLLTMRDTLSAKNEGVGSITCYAQDPAYTDVDKSVLEESGIVVVDDPEAFLEVDNFTAVFSCASDVPVREIISDIAQPAVMIWDNSEEEGIMVGEEQAMRTDPFTPRLRGMLRDMYDELEFPDDKHFGDLAIYVRRTAATMMTD